MVFIYNKKIFRTIFGIFRKCWFYIGNSKDIFKKKHILFFFQNLHFHFLKWSVNGIPWFLDQNHRKQLLFPTNIVSLPTDNWQLRYIDFSEAQKVMFFSRVSRSEGTNFKLSLCSNRLQWQMTSVAFVCKGNGLVQHSSTNGKGLV